MLYDLLRVLLYVLYDVRSIMRVICVYVSSAGLDTEIEGEWQAVGSKKTKPGQLSNKVQPSRSTTGGLFSDNSNFEKVVEGAMEKYQLTRYSSIHSVSYIIAGSFYDIEITSDCSKM